MTADHPKQHRDYLIGLIFAIAGAALFSVRPILVKLAYQEAVDSVTLLTLRMLFSAPFYLILLGIFLRNPIRRAKLNRKIIASTTLIGLMGYYAASLLVNRSIHGICV